MLDNMLSHVTTALSLDVYVCEGAYWQNSPANTGRYHAILFYSGRYKMDQNDCHHHAKPPGARDARHARAHPFITKPTLCRADSGKRDADDRDPEGPSPFPGGLKSKVNPGGGVLVKSNKHIRNAHLLFTFKSCNSRTPASSFTLDCVVCLVLCNPAFWFVA